VRGSHTKRAGGASRVSGGGTAGGATGAARAGLEIVQEIELEAMIVEVAAGVIGVEMLEVIADLESLAFTELVGIAGPRAEGGSPGVNVLLVEAGEVRRLHADVAAGVAAHLQVVELLENTLSDGAPPAGPRNETGAEGDTVGVLEVDIVVEITAHLHGVRVDEGPLVRDEGLENKIIAVVPEHLPIGRFLDDDRVGNSAAETEGIGVEVARAEIVAVANTDFALVAPVAGLESEVEARVQATVVESEMDAVGFGIPTGKDARGACGVVVGVEALINEVGGEFFREGEPQGEDGFVAVEATIAVVVQCEGGRVYCSSGGKSKVTDNEGKEITKIEGDSNRETHFDNFMKAVRSRKMENLNADCEKTHISSALCHTGLISHRLGEQLHDGEVRERIKEDSLLSERYASMQDHLAKNGVNLDKESITLGPWLKFNPETEWFEGNGDLDAKANELASRTYRYPYVVPKKV